MTATDSSAKQDRIEHRDDLSAHLARDHLASRGAVVTLHGPPGVGKTRLAHQMLSELATAADIETAAWVPLGHAPAGRHPAEVIARAMASAVAEVPGVLLRRSLLVLDGAERVVRPLAWQVQDLLAQAPSTRVLVTSRRLLGLSGERAVAVGGLSTSGGAESAAVRYLVARAGANGIGLSAREAGAVELCRALDGVPAAMDLAAIALRTRPATMLAQTPQAVLFDGAGTRSRLLRSLREQFRSCSPVQRILWQRLSVLSRGFTLDEAERAGAGGHVDRDAIARVLGELLSAAVLILDRDSRGRARYRMTAPQRLFGRRELDAAGEDVQVCAHRRRARRSCETRQPQARDAPGVKAIEGLTARQREVALLVADGSSNAEIGRALEITTRTAESHVRDILRAHAPESRGARRRHRTQHSTPATLRVDRTRSVRLVKLLWLNDVTAQDGRSL